LKRIKEVEECWKNHLMIQAAFRYCLGRRSYIVTECVQWLHEYWGGIPQSIKNSIIDEIQIALDEDLAGDLPDISCWNALLEYARKKAASDEAAT
jgi:hypothetical protein